MVMSRSRMDMNARSVEWLRNKDLAKHAKLWVQACRDVCMAQLTSRNKIGYLSHNSDTIHENDT